MSNETRNIKKQLERCLGELRTEYEAGEKAMAELEARQADFRQTLLRISGAIQVLVEELEKVTSTASGATDLPKGELKKIS